jgi:hypothetical protein
MKRISARERMKKIFTKEKMKNAFTLIITSTFTLIILSTLLVIFCCQTEAQNADVPRYEVGAQFSSITINDPSISNFRTEPGFGGRVTYNFNPNFAAEAQFDFYPNDNGARTYRTGGRTFEGLFGGKAGKRFERFGIYAKARPGFVRYGSVIGDTYTLTGLLAANTKPRTQFAADFGGVLEFYPSRCVVTRFDLGDTLIRYRQRTITAPIFNADGTITNAQFNIPSATTSNFQFSAGIGFRF